MKLATLCYLQKEGQTLMLFRNKKKNDYHEGKWNGLGGKFEAGESPEQCAIREVYEESGLTMIKPEMAGFLTFQCSTARTTGTCLYSDAANSRAI